MLKITRIKIDGQTENILIDRHQPSISFSLESNKQDTSLATCIITIGEWKKTSDKQLYVIYDGPKLLPFHTYNVHIKAISNHGDVAVSTTTFTTSRLEIPWQAKWITNANIPIEKGVSPKPVAFKHIFSAQKKISRVFINATALGIYQLTVNGSPISDDYFTPGFTSYLNQMQYQQYDMTSLIKQENELIAYVAPGWAVGRFNYSKQSHISADRQALLLEIIIMYEDGTEKVVSSDSSWLTTQETPYQFADWYDGEIYNANVDISDAKWVPVQITKPRKKTKLLAQFGPTVKKQETLKPVSSFVAPSGELIYDFGQNFAGVIHANFKSKKGQTLIFRHAEVLYKNELFVKSLRTAKATAIYHAIDGVQTYSPQFTYMGFRYVGVSGIDSNDIELQALVLHSDVKSIGDFECSNEDINRLQSAIKWGGKSNFVDIPTDCPQRDERQGWTGDISLFASTASFLFDTSRFYNKWLIDLNSEQARSGGIPMVVPRHGDKWPVMATAAWGDACILVPWAEYLARGDKELLQRQYPVMVKFLKAAKRLAGLFSINKHKRRIWKLLFHFGDWAAPNTDVKTWIKRGQWIATAYWSNSCGIVSQIAKILGKDKDEKYYKKLQKEINTAYVHEFLDDEARIHQEFQTAYVLPLHFHMTDEDTSSKLVEHLKRLIKENDGHLNTGFTGTPYILFALSDHNQINNAYNLLLQETSPSWLYMVKSGGTTIWERWDALRPDGTINIDDLNGQSNDDSAGGMVSFNHYANGAVGDWFYKRIAGLEPLTGGYERFRIKPIIGGNLTYANVRYESEYGEIVSNWKLHDNVLEMLIQVPVSTTCELILPNQQTRILHSGTYHIREKM